MTGKQPIIDVERLVEELKERVARERAAGAYADDLSGIELEVILPQAPWLAEGFDLAGEGARVRFRPELGYSSKPVIGPLITAVKKVVIRLLFFVLTDLAQQTDDAVKRLEAALAAEIAARESSLRSGLGAEAAEREAVAMDVRAIEGEVRAIEGELDRLQLVARLARLERATRPRPEVPAPTATAPEASPQPLPAAGAPLDYLAFEGRFRPEESVRERQQAYVEALRGAKRVVDLGCGRGELIELLGKAGISAYGVEIEPDFIELARERGLEIVAEDAVEHLGKLEPGAVDGIVASHVVEHLPAVALSALVALAAEKLAPGGTLIMETPNPESLVAGSINFHRDPTHVRPIHPDTLAFLCESAGFSTVEVRRLSPVPADERLPVPGDGRLDAIVERLNDLLYGYQDYAVLARMA